MPRRPCCEEGRLGKRTRACGAESLRQQQPAPFLPPLWGAWVLANSWSRRRLPQKANVRFAGLWAKEVASRFPPSRGENSRTMRTSLCKRVPRQSRADGCQPSSRRPPASSDKRRRRSRCQKTRRQMLLQEGCRWPRSVSGRSSRESAARRLAKINSDVRSDPPVGYLGELGPHRSVLRDRCLWGRRAA